MKGRGETGDSRENPPTSGIVRHYSHLPEIEPGLPWWEASVLIAQPPWPQAIRVQYPLDAVVGGYVPAGYSHSLPNRHSALLQLKVLILRQRERRTHAGLNGKIRHFWAPSLPYFTNDPRGKTGEVAVVASQLGNFDSQSVLRQRARTLSASRATFVCSCCSISCVSGEFTVHTGLPVKPTNQPRTSLLYNAAARLPPRRTGPYPRPGHSRIFTIGNCARRCRWSAGFLGDLPLPAPLNSVAAPFLPHFIFTGSRLFRVAQIFHFNSTPIGIAPDDATDRRVFSEISRFPRPCIPFSHYSTPIGSQDLVVRSRSNLWTHLNSLCH
ncbi:hypothetical protein PR048_001318 [Dryococelus australis]|uniref:Uncharacterized protein n=1 Tax=Dryococelus australis TaxID=614101 RepID=A0ABQ9IH44_9NEOP|nr:hypothetical protein PR048_001318 [Dryococelus australis]